MDTVEDKELLRRLSANTQLAVLKRFGFGVLVLAILFCRAESFGGEGAQDKTELDLGQYLPTQQDLQRAEKYRYMENPTTIEEAAKKFEHLKKGADLGKVQSAILPGTEPSQQTLTNSMNQQTGQTNKQKYLFYLISASVPDATIENVFSASHNLKGLNFYGVLRGIDKERKVLTKIQGLKDFTDITVKVNPLIFRSAGADMVPAFVYAECGAPNVFRSDDCDFKSVLFGDISLLGALKIMADKDANLKTIYEDLKNAF